MGCDTSLAAFASFPLRLTGDCMGRRGRGNGSPISLFSFQDIITSVTAIMILLTLILTLELITKMNLRGVAADDRRVAVELQQSLTTLRERLEGLRSQSADARHTAMQVASQSVKQVEADRRRTQRHSETLANSVASLESQLKAARQKRRDTEKGLLQAQKAHPETARLQDNAARDRAAAAMLEEQNKTEAKRQQDIAKELAESPQLVSTLVFNPHKGEELKPILAELSARGISVLGDGDEGVKAFGWGVLGPPNTFLRWLSEKDKNREYLVVMLRPSGLSKLDSTKEAISSKGFDLGLELVSDDMDIVMAEDAQQPL